MNLSGMFAVTCIFLRGLPAAKANSVGPRSFKGIYACQVIVTNSVPSRWEIYTRHCKSLRKVRSQLLPPTPDRPTLDWSGQAWPG